MIVADTNLVAYLYIPGERNEEARKVFSRDPRWISPLLWRSEFCSVLHKHVLTGAVLLEEALAAFRAAAVHLGSNERLPDPENVLRLAGGSRCSTYDCEFVALARELGVPLVTADSRVLREFPDDAVSMEVFAG